MAPQLQLVEPHPALTGTVEVCSILSATCHGAFIYDTNGCEHRVSEVLVECLRR